MHSPYFDISWDYNSPYKSTKGQIHSPALFSHFFQKKPAKRLKK